MSKQTDCRHTFVDGQLLFKAMLDRGLTESQLAKKAGVAEQTIRNYLASSLKSPWPARSEKARSVCDVLGLDHQAVKLVREEPSTLWASLFHN